MKVSLFKLGIVLVVIGAVWISLVFVETEKIHNEVFVKQSNSFELESEFYGEDIGYFKVYMPEFSGEAVFVQIIDAKDNVIQAQKIQTKMSVGYFDYTEDGSYSVKVTNISKNPIRLQIEFGDTNSKEMIPAGILILVGSITLVVMSYFKIKNYKMAQPDENIS